MRFIASALLALHCLAMPAQAALLDLSYELDLAVTSTSHDGVAVGDTGTGTIGFSLDTATGWVSGFDCELMGIGCQVGVGMLDAWDPLTGAFFSTTTNWSDNQDINLMAQAFPHSDPMSVFVGWEDDDGPFAWTSVSFAVNGFRVSGLPRDDAQILPTPLPAPAALLLGGLAGLGLLRRRA